VVEKFFLYAVVVDNLKQLFQHIKLKSQAFMFNISESSFQITAHCEI